MSIRRKRKLDVDTRTRDLIVEEAERFVAMGGLDGLRLDDIATSLGITRASIYTHYHGRDGILGAIAERALRQLSQHFQDDKDADPVRTITAGITALVAFLIQHKAYAYLLARDFATPGGLPAVNSVLGRPESIETPELLSPLYRRLETIVDRGCKLGTFKKVDPYLFLTILLGSIMVCLLQHRRDVENLEETITKIALALLSR
ncbi:MAG: TetR/AcrR family transcriptional regulator [Rhodospirillaceae bacterium]|nr:TetR/AcrR family transcriptional regulator [Rhodospirillaceae bacterium]MDD9999220.1 TetR/AcrR family transcriptional regulator [Rhodospirillaceae bacterium]MDE0362189.1 TetR/AcrR family transcriptional regulator [Rhodospirillaceae bacterium]